MKWDTQNFMITLAAAMTMMNSSVCLVKQSPQERAEREYNPNAYVTEAISKSRYPTVPKVMLPEMDLLRSIR